MTVQNKLKIRQDASSIQNNMYNYRTDQNQVVLYSLHNEIDSGSPRIAGRQGHLGCSIA